MKTIRLIEAIVMSAIALLLSSCINGNPSHVGNSSVSSNTSSTASEGTTDVNDIKTGVFPTSPHPIVNVYLEISGSMNGYVNGGTSVFQQVVKEYLSGINNANFASAVNYFYINKKITPKGTDLTSFITRLTPAAFGAAGGGATTDIGNLFKTILGTMDSNTVSVFISDCIISPGSNQDTGAYARGQMTDVRDAIVGYTNQFGDLACMVYQFDSGFKGRYFDYQNRARQVNMQRPFYIWVFGHTAHVARMKLQYVPDDDFKVAPIRNQWMVFNTKLDNLQKDGVLYGLLLPNDIKNGKYVYRDRTQIRGIQRMSDNDYRFSFGANLALASDLMGENYIEDTANYKKIINKATKEIFYGEIEKDYNQKSPYSHSFRVHSSSPFQKGIFTLALIPEVPSWAYTCSDIDDRTFNGTNDNMTYGLKYIFDGIYSGYNNAGHANILTEFNFEIR